MSYCSLLICFLSSPYLLNIKFTIKSDWILTNYQFTHIIKPSWCNSWFHLKAMISMYEFCFLSWAGCSVLEIVSFIVHRRATSKKVWPAGLVLWGLCGGWRKAFCLFYSAHSLLNGSALLVLHLSVMRASGIDHLLLYSMKSSIPVTDLISVRKGIVAKDVYVRFSWFISDWKREGEKLGSRNEWWLLCSIVSHCEHVLTSNQVRDKSY